MNLMAEFVKKYQITWIYDCIFGLEKFDIAFPSFLNAQNKITSLSKTLNPRVQVTQ